jgi:predicted outer membrane repeat protein
MRTRYLVAILVLLAVLLPAASASASGVVSTCNEAGLLAALAGGGTVTFSCSGTITLASTIAITENTTIDGTGQMVTISGGNAVGVFRVNPGVSLTLKYLTVANGEDTGPVGGGGVLNYRGTLTVVDCVFASNSGLELGGGIANYGTASVSGSTFSGNSGGEYGGGILNTGPNAWLSVSNCSFSSNNATYGGGLVNWSATATVSSSTFSNNSAGDGGGIKNLDGSLTVSNSTFSANRANTGGGISNGSFSDVNMINCTLSGNYAYYWGGAISTQGDFTLANTIVANSTGGQNCRGSIIDGGGNLSYPAYPDFNCPSIGGDPLLGPLQNNGGRTQTMLLGPGSAAIDAANDAICAAAPVNNLDQRGAIRPSGLHCDIGAVEQGLYAGPPIVIDIKPGSDPNSVNCRNGHEVIAIAILSTDLFDATTVDHTAVTFHGAAEVHVDRNTGEPTRHEEDLDGDGDVDLVLHFRLGSTNLTCQSTVGALWGWTFAGEAIVATDSVRMVGGE